jgi:large subunit ribosomal protein L38e
MSDKVILIKESKKITKFKLRGKKYLYTFKTADKGKASKLIASLPASNGEWDFSIL